MSLAQQIAEHLGDWSERLGAQAAEGVYFALRDNCPEITGVLKDSIDAPQRVGNAPFVEFRIAVNPPDKRDEYTEHGTEPHSIDPHPPIRFLRFPDKAGTIVFARHVDHPGNTAHPWFFPTCAFEWPQQLRELADTIELVT